ncbi:signal peptide peptidase SppA [Candidatus Woesearchaeota archaeon]|nr:signal peptide peptidase SppA [Candidatus Woesearchaeota archaeon]
MAKKQENKIGIGARWGVVIFVLIFIGLISMITAFIIGLFVSTSDIEEPGNVAHITIEGPIVASSAGGMFSEEMADSTDIIDLIRDANENEEVQAILLEINSPGGTAVASHEIARAVKESNKTTVAWIREVGASGAYWIASAADHIVADPLSITGSIGVIGSYIEFGGTLERYNASYRRLVAGEYKDMGSPLKEMTPAEEQIMNETLGLMRDYFVDDVARNRGLDKADVSKLADGRFYLGGQAKELGLVDELGSKAEAVSYIEKKLSITADIAEYEHEESLAEVLFGAFGEQSFHVGEGIGKSLLDAKVRGVEVRT